MVTVLQKKENYRVNVYVFLRTITVSSEIFNILLLLIDNLLFQRFSQSLKTSAVHLNYQRV